MLWRSYPLQFGPAAQVLESVLGMHAYGGCVRALMRASMVLFTALLAAVVPQLHLVASTPAPRPLACPPLRCTTTAMAQRVAPLLDGTTKMAIDGDRARHLSRQVSLAGSFTSAVLALMVPAAMDIVVQSRGARPLAVAPRSGPPSAVNAPPLSSSSPLPASRLAPENAAHPPLPCLLSRSPSQIPRGAACCGRLGCSYTERGSCIWTKNALALYPHACI